MRKNGFVREHALNAPSVFETHCIVCFCGSGSLQNRNEETGKWLPSELALHMGRKLLQQKNQFGLQDGLSEKEQKPVFLPVDNGGNAVLYTEFFQLRQQNTGRSSILADSKPA